MASFKSGLPTLALFVFALLIPTVVMAEDCKFADGSIADLPKDSHFTVSDESEASVDGSLVASNLAEPGPSASELELMLRSLRAEISH